MLSSYTCAIVDRRRSAPNHSARQCLRQETPGAQGSASRRTRCSPAGPRNGSALSRILHALPHTYAPPCSASDADRTWTTRGVREWKCHHAQATAIESAEEFRAPSAVRGKYQTIGTRPLACADERRPIEVSADGVRIENDVRYGPQITIRIQRQASGPKREPPARIGIARGQWFTIEMRHVERHAP